jgi:hypothetical protein
MKILSPKILLHVEGALLLAASVFFYARLSGDWLLFAVLLLAPDLSMLGYLAGPRIGAMCYNAIHVYLLPTLLAAYGGFLANPFALSLALVWFAHLGGDRMLGFGLKYPTAFRDTHLDRL